MNKEFKYYSCDIPSLRKTMFFRFLFLVLFVLTFAWQLVMLLISYNNETLTRFETIISICVLVYALEMFAFSYFYILRTMRYISVIKKRGTCVATVPVLFRVKHDSFIKLYSFVTKIIALLSCLVLLATITYSILEATYLETMSIFMPALILLSVSGFNSVFHIHNDIVTCQTARNFRSIF